MELNPYHHVVITNSYIVDFLSRHQHNPVITNTCLRAFEDACRNLDECINECIKYCDAKNQDADYNRECRDRERLLIDMFNSFEQRFIDRQSNSQRALESIIQDRFNAMSLNNSIKNAMQSCIEEMKGCQNKDVDVCLIRFRDSIRDDLEKAVQPILMVHDTIYKQVVSIPESIRDGSSVHREEVYSLLNRLSQQVSESTMVLDNKLQPLKAAIDATFSQFQESKYVSEHVKNIPNVTRGIISDVLRSVEDKCTCINNMIGNTYTLMNQMSHDMVSSNTALSSICNKIDVFEKQKIKNDCNTRLKGSDGEQTLLSLLDSKLLDRDGYKVENVAGKSHSCDILITCINKPNIRLECKSYNDKVQLKEVTKFKRDLGELNNHGIFVSLHSSIAGVSDIELQQLNNGKFAVFLAHNNYNVDTIISMLLLLYKLDELTEKNASCISVTPESLTKLHAFIQDYTAKIQAVKQHMKESISMLNDIHLSGLETLLLGNAVQIQQFVCDKCKKEFKNQCGLANHMRSCRQ